MKKITLLCALLCMQGFMGYSDPNSDLIGDIDPNAESRGVIGVRTM